MVVYNKIDKYKRFVEMIFVDWVNENPKKVEATYAAVVIT